MDGRMGLDVAMKKVPKRPPKGKGRGYNAPDGQVIVHGADKQGIKVHI